MDVAAYAVNNGGDVAGYGNIGAAMTAFVWYALAINDSGAAAGVAQTPSGALHPVIWSGGSIRDLGTLGGANSFAFGLNNSGEAVGYSFLSGSGQTDAFYMTAASCGTSTA